MGSSACAGTLPQDLRWGQTAARQQRTPPPPTATMREPLRGSDNASAGRSDPAGLLAGPAPGVFSRRMQRVPRRHASVGGAAAAVAAAAALSGMECKEAAGELVARQAQEQEDAALARAVFEEEQRRMARDQARMSAHVSLLARLEEEAAAAEAGLASASAVAASSRGGGWGGFGTRTGTAMRGRRYGQQHRHGPQDMASAAGPAAGGADGTARAATRHWGAINLASALLGLPLGLTGAGTVLRGPRSGGGNGGRGVGGREALSQGLRQMRDAMLGMQRAGLPPHLLFSDRDFTAGEGWNGIWEHLCGLFVLLLVQWRVQCW
jgi:hypothetical protein